MKQKIVAIEIERLENTIAFTVPVGAPDLTNLQCFITTCGGTNLFAGP